MKQKELIKLAAELEALARTPLEEVDVLGPVELLSDLHKEAELKVDKEYTTSIVHGILSTLENLNG